jgi:basic amino acid/polyamine antiporter, APA family
VTAPPTAPASESPALVRHFGWFQATALNVTMIVGAGVFITIPFMLKELPGPYALLGWLAAGGLMLVDGLIWSELGATMPGSGGSYLYLLECYGRNRWGRLMAFLFIWQFLISGPLEIASGVIALEQFSTSIHPNWKKFNEEKTLTAEIGTWNDGEETKSLTVSIGPTRILGTLIILGLLLLLYRRISTLGKWTVTFWLGVLGAIAWILLAGGSHYQSAMAFDFSGDASRWPDHFWLRLGKVMILAMYSYLGYYNICYIGDEVRDPGRTIPRSIFLSAILVCLMFVGLHLVMLGVVSWTEVVKENPDDINLPALVMERVYNAQWAATLMSVLLMWSCFGSAFAGLLGYSRIPFGAARQGHFFAALGKVHPVLHIPHVSLLLVVGMTLFWSFFDLANVINALLTTRILEQFIGQIFGVILLRRLQPNRPRPYKMWLYPLPCGLALVGWLFMYLCAGWPFVLLGLGTLGLGAVVFLIWSFKAKSWPFVSENGLNK